MIKIWWTALDACTARHVGAAVWSGASWRLIQLQAGGGQQSRDVFTSPLGSPHALDGVPSASASLVAAGRSAFVSPRHGSSALQQLVARYATSQVDGMYSHESSEYETPRAGTTGSVPASRLHPPPPTRRAASPQQLEALLLESADLTSLSQTLRQHQHLVTAAVLPTAYNVAVLMLKQLEHRRKRKHLQRPDAADTDAALQVLHERFEKHKRSMSLQQLAECLAAWSKLPAAADARHVRWVVSEAVAAARHSDLAVLPAGLVAELAAAVRRVQSREADGRGRRATTATAATAAAAAEEEEKEAQQLSKVDDPNQREQYHHHQRQAQQLQPPLLSDDQSRALWKRLCGALSAAAPGMDGLQAAVALWSVVPLRDQSLDLQLSECVSALAAQLRPKAGHLDAHGVSLALWSTVKLGLLTAELRGALVEQLRRKLGVVPPQELSVAVVALAEHAAAATAGSGGGDGGSASASAAAAAAAPGRRKGDSSSSRSSSVQEQQLVTELAAAAARSLPQFQPQALANTVWGLSKLGLPYDADWMDAVCDAACDLFLRLLPVHVSMIASSLARYGHDHAGFWGRLAALVEDEAALRRAGFTTGGLREFGSLEVGGGLKVHGRRMGGVWALEEGKGRGVSSVTRVTCTLRKFLFGSSKHSIFS